MPTVEGDTFFLKELDFGMTGGEEVVLLLEDNFEEGGSYWRIAGEGGLLLLVVVHSCIGSVPLAPDSSVKFRPLVQFVILPLRVFVLGLLSSIRSSGGPHRYSSHVTAMKPVMRTKILGHGVPVILEHHFRETVILVQSGAADRAHLRSHAGPGASRVPPFRHQQQPAVPLMWAVLELAVPQDQ